MTHLEDLKTTDVSDFDHEQKVLFDRIILCLDFVEWLASYEPVTEMEVYMVNTAKGLITNLNAKIEPNHDAKVAKK